MTFVAASSLCAGLPDDLQALEFRRRDADGPTVRLAVAGDVGLSGRVRKAAGGDYAALLAEVAPAIRTADIGFVNVEFPLVRSGREGDLHRGDPAAAAALREAGFTVGQVANSHAPDFGPAGLGESAEAVTAAGMLALGVGDSQAMARRVVRTDRNGLRIGWIAGARTNVPQDSGGPFFWEVDEPSLIEEIRAARPGVDVLIVSLHMGLALLDYPPPAFKALVERSAAAGADLVLMHHAHILQPVQALEGGAVACYCLGNFLLDWREGNVEVPVLVREQNEAGVFLFDLDRRGVARAAVLPTCIDDGFHARWATGARGLQILRRLDRISRDIEGDYGMRYARQRVERTAVPMLRVLGFHVRRGNWDIVRNILTHVRPEHFRLLGQWVLGRVRRLRS